MLHPNIEGRFSSGPKKSAYQNISDQDWKSWQWQLQSSVAQNTFVTPYYSSLMGESAPLIEAQKYLYDVKNNLLALSDEAIVDQLTTSEDGVIEIFLPFISVLPQRITTELVNKLKNRDQIIVHCSINHPKECTLELVEACSLLADNGIIINNHMTLLKGINDSAEIVKELNLKLLMMRVRPYSIYLYEKRSQESSFFDLNREAGIDILESLRGWTSGLAVPHLLAQKSDKSFEAILPNYIKKNEGENFIFRNYKHMDYEYSNS